jgi:hypothetical protein
MLLTCLRPKDPERLCAALNSLAMIGKNAEITIHELERPAISKHEKVAKRAKAVLKRVRPN